MGDFFGVDQGAVVNSMGESQTPEVESKPILENSEAPKPETAKEILDLDKLERFRFAGKEWNPKDLRNSYLMREDYTRKTQEVAEARKFADNFKYDMQSLVKDPGLMDKFASIYPKEYVESAKEIMQMLRSGNTPSPNQTQQGQIDPNFLKEFKEVKGWIQSQTEQQKQVSIEQANTWLDNQYTSLSKKYPNAVEEIVTARAQALIDMQRPVNSEVLDKLFEQSQKEMTDRFVTAKQNKVKEQLKVGQSGKDVGQGGSPASEGPKKYKTFKEAKAAMLADLNSK